MFTHGNFQLHGYPNIEDTLLELKLHLPNPLVDAQMVFDCEEFLHVFNDIQAVLTPNNSGSDKPHLVRGLKQGVKLTGLGDEVFEQFQEAVDIAHGVFERELGVGKVRTIHSKPYEGQQAFDVATRYFTDRGDAPTQQHTPFSKDEDPKYILELLRKHRFIHSEDNIVQYGTKEYSSEGKVR